MAYENSVYEYNENGELCVRVTGTGGGGGGGAVSSVNGKTGAVVLNASDVGAVKHDTDYELPSVLKMDDSGCVRRTYETGSIVEKAVMTYDGPDPDATYDPQVGGMFFEIVNENAFVSFLGGEGIVNIDSLEKNIPQNFRVVLRNSPEAEYPYSIDVYNDNGDKIYTKDDYFDDEYLPGEVGLEWDPNLGSGNYPILSSTSTGFVFTIEKKDVKEIQTETVGVLAPSPEGLPDADLVIRSGMVQWGAPVIKSIGTVTYPLVQGGWTNNTQSAYLGVDQNSIIIVSPDPNSQKIYTEFGIKCISQGTNTLTFQCDEQPDNDVTVNILYINK